MKKTTSIGAALMLLSPAHAGTPSPAQQDVVQMIQALRFAQMCGFPAFEAYVAERAKAVWGEASAEENQTIAIEDVASSFFETTKAQQRKACAEGKKTYDYVLAHFVKNARLPRQTRICSFDKQTRLFGMR
jgi:hypothetical protein